MAGSEVGGWVWGYTKVPLVFWSFVEIVKKILVRVLCKTNSPTRSCCRLSKRERFSEMKDEFISNHQRKGAAPSVVLPLFLQSAVHLLVFTLKRSSSYRHRRELGIWDERRAQGRKQQLISADFAMVSEAETDGNSSVFKMQINTVPLRLSRPSIYCLITLNNKLI